MKALVGCLTLLVASSSWAADWPQWRGPDRNAVSRETGLLREWPTDGPPLGWISKAAGRGFGGPAIVGDRVYILGAIGDKEPIEHVIALDASGKKLWASPIARAYDFPSNSWSLGPNSTPSIDGKLIFALGSQGVFVCVDNAGKERWRTDLVKDMGGSVNPVTGEGLGWGYSWSPLVVDRMVIVAPGGEGGLLAALDVESGKVLWRSKAIKDECTYSSPILAKFGGVPQVVYASQNKVYGVALKDGSTLWTYEKKRQAEEIVAPTPIIHGENVFVSAAMAGSELIRIAKTGEQFEAANVWNNKVFANLHGGMVLVDKHVYGSNEMRFWKCTDIATGAETWESRRPGFGSVVCADGFLYCVSQDDSSVSLVEAVPDQFKLKSQFKLPEQSRLRRPSGKLWTHPVIANGMLYLRDQELLFCYQVKK